MHYKSIFIQHYSTTASNQDIMENYGIFLLSQPSREQLRHRGVQTIQYVRNSGEKTESEQRLDYKK